MLKYKEAYHNAVMNDLDEWVDSIKDSGKLILVEGKKDREALGSLGIKNTLAVCSKSTYKSVEAISGITREVIILTDLDKEGRKLYSELKHNVQRSGIKVDTVFREYLFRCTKITHIEGIATTFKNRNNNQYL